MLRAKIAAWLYLSLGVGAFIAIARPDERDVDALSDRAREALAAKKWSEAARTLQQLAALAPGVSEVHANLGLAYYFEGRPSEALESFERALKLNPKLPQARLMTGLCYVELGHDREAIGILEPVFHSAPSEELSRLIGLGLERAYTDVKQFDKAFATGEELIRRYPNDPEILFQISRSHADRSYQLMADLLRSAPDSAWVHYANAEVQESLERFDAAKQEYANALRRDPYMAGVHYHLGRMLVLGTRSPESVEEARKEFEAELAISPRNADAEYELGEIDREAGNLEGALAHFERAAQYHREFAQALIGMAKTLLKMGRTREAIPHLQDATRLEPANKIPHFLLATAYKSIGDESNSAKELALYQKLGSPVPPETKE